MEQQPSLTQDAQQTPAEPDLTGQSLGDYQILRLLGRGGMGQVYLAEQISLKRKVALKLLKPELAANEVSLKRFKAEAENVARATHANIVQVYAIHQTGSIHYMALEYVEGRNLRDYLEKKGSPDLAVALGIMRQVAAALQRASELGIIHRDIKPENILLTRKGEVKVADFGLSRVFENAAGQPLHLTQSGVSMGTPLYMSPEQVEGKSVDPRTDVYSFGVTCYHMFAGQPPFRGQSPFEVAVQHVQKEPQPLAEIRPDLPAELCAIIHKMMAKKPEDRYQTCREIGREVARLRDVLAGITTMQMGMQSGSGIAHLVASLTSSSELAEPVNGLTPIPPRRSLWRPVLLTAGLVAALALGVYAGYRNLPTDAGPTADVKTAPDGKDKEEEEPPPPKPAVTAKEREQYHRTGVQEYFDEPKKKNAASNAVSHATKLTVLLLQTHRLDDAEKLHKDLAAAPSAAVRNLAKLGRGMVLAFRDKPDESNDLFFSVFDAAKPDKASKLALWRDDAAFNELLARAINHNFINLRLDKTDYPDLPTKLQPLDKYRRPPAPVLKAPPVGP